MLLIATSIADESQEVGIISKYSERNEDKIKHFSAQRKSLQHQIAAQAITLVLSIKQSSVYFHQTVLRLITLTRAQLRPRIGEPSLSNPNLIDKLHR